MKLSGPANLGWIGSSEEYSTELLGDRRKSFDALAKEEVSLNGRARDSTE